MRTSHAPDPLLRDYDAQVSRADYLASIHPASQEILAFYSKILSFQKTLHAQLARIQSPSQRESQQFAAIRDSLDLTLLLPHFRPFLHLIKDGAPKPLASVAHELSILPSDHWVHLLAIYWQAAGLPAAGDDDPDKQVFPLNSLTQFFPRVFLHPYAALLASQSAVPPPSSIPNFCPLCGALPLLGILRPEGEGAKRNLLCSFCSTEWSYRRILCPRCGETDEAKLPVFVADQFPHIRTEACDTCRTYLRAIDLSKDGHAIPTVDDLAALPLSLWAHEHQYSRLYPNLLST